MNTAACFGTNTQLEWNHSFPLLGPIHGLPTPWFQTISFADAFGAALVVIAVIAAARWGVSTFLPNEPTVDCRTLLPALMLAVIAAAVTAPSLGLSWSDQQLYRQLAYWGVPCLLAGVSLPASSLVAMRSSAIRGK